MPAICQPDGKLVAAGSSFSLDPPILGFGLARYHPDGSLDLGFDGDGLVTTLFGVEHSGATALVLQPDGKLVAAGCKAAGITVDCAEIALARYDADGSLDGTFGLGGRVTTPVGTTAGALALALQPDGKLLAAGFTAPGIDSDDTDVTLVRYNPDGSPDGTFGVGGIVITSIGTTISTAEAVVVEPDGRIVVAGFTRAGFEFELLLVPYDAAGTLDGTCGVVTVQAGAASSGALALVRQPDGKLVAAGAADVPFDDPDFAVLRFLPGYCGSIDRFIGRHFVAIKFPDLVPEPGPDPPPLRLRDQFETQTASVGRGRQLLVRAAFDGRTPAPSDTEPSLMGWEIRSVPGEPKHVRRLGLRVIDDLGTLTLDTMKPDLLLVPTSIGLAGPPAPPDPGTHPLDNYKCYAVRRSAGAPRPGSRELTVAGHSRERRSPSQLFRRTGPSSGTFPEAPTAWAQPSPTNSSRS
jgi:uncharacterized delta-60 repeat protein